MRGDEAARVECDVANSSIDVIGSNDSKDPIDPNGSEDSTGSKDPIERFVIAGGGVTGRAHAQAGRNGQDAWAWGARDGALAAVVCDGCSSSPASEVGARLGSRLVVEAVLEAFAGAGGRTIGDAAAWARVGAAIIDRLSVIAGAASAQSDASGAMVAPAEVARAIVRDCLLFTVVGVVITRDECVLFHTGDGLVVLNGEMIRLGPYPDNAPPYLGYALLDRSARAELAVIRRVPAPRVRSILLGTDGALEIDEAAARGRSLPGSAEPLGPLAQFWTDPRYVTNPDAIRRRLALANRASVRAAPGGRGLVREAALLEDDTTVVVIRRREDFTLAASQHCTDLRQEDAS